MGNHVRPHLQLFITLSVMLASLLPLAARAQSFPDVLDTTNLIWTTGGDVTWFAQSTNTHDGVDAARSGRLGANQMSWIETTVQGPATLDYFIGTVSGDTTLGLTIIENNDDSEQQAWLWSSVPVWQEIIRDLPAGPQTFRWRVSSSLATNNTGYVLLDEFKVLPPRPLSLSIGPEEQILYSGSFAIIQASELTGTPPIQLQWRKAGVAIPDATNQWFYIPIVATNDSGNYTLYASNSQGTLVSSNAMLTVISSSPIFESEPYSATAYTGQDYALWGGFKGSMPFSYQWRKNGTNLTELTSAGWGSATLALTNVTFADAGSYTLFVTNDYGSIESTNAVITVLRSVAPTITKHPRSLEVAEGVNTWLSASATGDPNPCGTWIRVDFSPPPSGPTPPQPCQPTPLTRSFPNVSPTNAGIYYAHISNAAGSTNSRSALLTVLPPISLINTTAQSAMEMRVTNQLAFLAQGSAGFSILSVSNPTAPVLLGNYDTPGYAYAIQVAGSWAYVADNSALRIFSVTNPATPTLVGTFNTPSGAKDVVVRDNIAFVAANSAGLLILNVSNPAAPSLIGSYVTNLDPRYLSVSGDFVYLTSLPPVQGPGGNPKVGGLLIVNVANPAQPWEAGRFGSSFTRVAARDGIVFLTGGSGLQVVDARDPLAPQWIGNFWNYASSLTPIPHLIPLPVSALQLIGDRIHLAGYSDTNATLLILDVRNPAEPIPVGYYSSSGQDLALAVEENMVFTAGLDQQVKVFNTPFHVSPEQKPTLTITVNSGLQLGIHGSRGRNFNLEASSAPVGQPWQTIRTLLLTNDSSSVSLPQPAGAQFFRLHQLD